MTRASFEEFRKESGELLLDGVALDELRFCMGGYSRP